MNTDGEPIGKAHKNPLLDSRQFEVEYIDGTIEILSANIIAENILSQVDDEGQRQLLLDEIVDHRRNEYNEGKRTQENDKKRSRTTKGWELCVRWKDGSTNWIPLKDMKNGLILETARYAINNRIDKEPAFIWWVPNAMKKAKYIISKVKSKYWERTHKYGIRIPKTVQEAYAIDVENGDSYWTDAIREEMAKIKGAVRVYDGPIEKFVERLKSRRLVCC